MLGHAVAALSAKQVETFITLREPIARYSYALSSFHDHHISNVSASDFESVTRAFAIARPTVVINCIGIVKQLTESHDLMESIVVNSLFPHKVALLCQATGARFITTSTDCVFSGSEGNYCEHDKPDPEDLYGHTKLLGEVSKEGCLTIRTSMIGRQLSGKHGLLEWFLSQEGQTVPGFSKMIFSGLTTQAIAEILLTIIKDHPNLSGIYHLAAEPISKYDLLLLIKDVGGLDVTIVPDGSKVLNRSLNAERLRRDTGIEVPSWREMIEKMVATTVIQRGSRESRIHADR